MASNEEIITKLQAGGIGKTDLITMYFGYLPLMAEGGLLEPIDPSKVAQFGDLIPQFNAQQSIRFQDQLYGVPWNWGSLPLMYDPAAVSAAPESWLDIMKPEYKGKVAMVDDPLGNLLIWGTVVTGKPMGTLLTREELAKVIDKLIDIKKNHARAFFATYGDMADAFARNEVTVSAIGWEAVAVWAKGKGKEIKYTIPKEGTGMFMDCLCIPKDAPHQDLSYKMINHIDLARAAEGLRDRAERRHHQSQGGADAAAGTGAVLQLRRHRRFHEEGPPAAGAANRVRWHDGNL